MNDFYCQYSTACPFLSKVQNELEKKLDAEKARHRAAVLELENVIVDLMVENYRYESRVKALERLLEEYEKNKPIIKTTWGMTDTHEEAKP